MESCLMYHRTSVCVAFPMTLWVTGSSQVYMESKLNLSARFRKCLVLKACILTMMTVPSPFSVCKVMVTLLTTYLVLNLPEGPSTGPFFTQFPLVSITRCISLLQNTVMLSSTFGLCLLVTCTILRLSDGLYV